MVTDQQVWIMLHSGSRGAGNKIGMYFIDKAKEVAIEEGRRIIKEKSKELGKKTMEMIRNVGKDSKEYTDNEY